MGTGKGGKDQLAAVGVASWHAQLVAVFNGFADLRQIGKIDLWVHALGEHVQAQSDEIDVAGALAVAKQAALDAVRAGHKAQLGGGDSLAAVIVRVQGEHDVFAAGQVAVHPFDGIGVDIG